MIISCGEALIDMLPCRSERGEPLYAPVVGGAAFNTARALGRLGQASGYFGCLSRDAFGQMLCDSLQAAQVNYQLCPRGELPTALALVDLSQGSAKYSFHFSDTAGLSLRVQQLPPVPGNVNALHFGGISLIAEPCGTAYEALLLRESANRLVSIDPNIRPAFIRDESAYRSRLNRLLASSHVIKVSDEDLDWLCPGQAAGQVARVWLQTAALLVVVTRGADGATVYSSSDELHVAAVPTKVVDTVGAGDTFVAGLWAGLQAEGLVERSALACADRQALERAVAYAQRAASISVSRAGADSPWLHEMSGTVG